MDIDTTGYQRERTELVDGNPYFESIFDAIAHSAWFDATSNTEISDFLIRLSARVRTGAVSGYRKRLLADLNDPNWEDAAPMTAKKGARVKHKATGREGRIVGARTANAIYVRWDDVAPGTAGMGELTPWDVLRIQR
jgi:hypothetical protein